MNSKFKGKLEGNNANICGWLKESEQVFYNRYNYRLFAYLTVCLSRNFWLQIYGSESSKLVPNSTMIVNKHVSSASSLVGTCSCFGIKHLLSGYDFNLFNSYLIYH